MLCTADVAGQRTKEAAPKLGPAEEALEKAKTRTGLDKETGEGTNVAPALRLGEAIPRRRPNAADLTGKGCAFYGRCTWAESA